MSLDPRARRFLDMLALYQQNDTGAEPTAARRREGFARLMHMGARPVDIASTQDIAIDGPGGPMALRLYDAEDARGGPAAALVFLHGGGLVAGNIETHDGICRALATASRAIVVSVDYRLAPEARFPASLDDATAATDWVMSKAGTLGIDRTRIAIGGESAGALLATLIGNGFSPVATSLKAQLLLCPVIDLAGTTASRQQFARGFLIDDDTIARDVEHCLGQGADASGLPSPLRQGDLSCTPASIIVGAECDPFRDEAEDYARILAERGVPVQYTCEPGMVHAFHGLNGLFPQANASLAKAGRDLAGLLR